MIQSAKIPSSQYVFEFREQIAKLSSSETSSLVIAHPDDCMISRLQSICSDQDLAIATIPQSSWDFANESFVDWEPCVLQFKSIILVGTSQGGVPETEFRISRASDNAAQLSSKHRGSFLERVSNALSRVKANEAHFTQQLQTIRRNPMIAGAATRNPELVHGLFYRVESGSFCQFDFASAKLQYLA